MKSFAPQPKRSANIAKHGYDPADFETAFSFDRYLSRRTKPSQTGRERRLLVGTWFNDAVVTVIISPLGSEGCDVVSVRDASDKERAAYDNL
ncbi:BrnT family toxin [Lichenifustis flavocetrariae]|uniref:BrnT family toxin n=1 Tax=Lichenifustis flavocetrariae TaxID=2949735 RepID=A0AA41Z4Q0_9HYPH|nr:BrnT family toxin [Lichenifustis flavocetrariae]MCW6509222.1 BrnT family toxin [Lichenifustis flavocetrariae]